MWSVCVLLYINIDKQWDEEYSDLLSSLSFVFAARLGTTILLQKLYSFFKTFFSNCYFKKNICKSHQNSEKRFWRKVLEKGNNKNRCNLVPSSEWLFNLIFVSFLVTTESNGRNSIADIIQNYFFRLTMLCTLFYRHILLWKKYPYLIFWSNKWEGDCPYVEYFMF